MSHSRRAQAKADKRAAKLASQKEAVAREVQGEMKRKLEEDERRQEGKRSEIEAAAQREVEARCEGERAEHAKRDAAKKAEQAKKESFDKKIEMKRVALTEAAWMAETTKETKAPGAGPPARRRAGRPASLRARQLEGPPAWANGGLPGAPQETQNVPRRRRECTPKKQPKIGSQKG